MFKHDGKMTNPLNHPFPHAKLRNIKLTSITRLNKNTEALSRYMTTSNGDFPMRIKMNQLVRWDDGTVASPRDMIDQGLAEVRVVPNFLLRC